jgi:hypothetical protein
LVLVKVTRTYEKDIYPYGIAGSGCGNDADGLQTGRGQFYSSSGWNKRANTAILASNQQVSAISNSIWEYSSRAGICPALFS